MNGFETFDVPASEALCFVRHALITILLPSFPTFRVWRVSFIIAKRVSTLMIIHHPVVYLSFQPSKLPPFCAPTHGEIPGDEGWAPSC